MPSLERYEAFIAIVDRGSLSAAAEHLGRSLQSVSRALATLEDELGAELIRRTTRRLHPTPGGLALHRRLKPALRDIADARAEATREAARVGGLFRIGASVLFGSRFVVPAAVAYAQRFPDVRVDMVLDDAVADLVEHRLDVAVRIGDLGADSLRSRKVGELRRVVVAAPAYLARHGVPRRPEDLTAHACVVRTFGPEGDVWPLTAAGAAAPVRVRGYLRCDDAAGANAAVLLGAGIGLAPLWQVRRDLDEGRLDLLLPAHEPPAIRVSAVWPGGGETPARTRLFVETLHNRLAGERV